MKFENLKNEYTEYLKSVDKTLKTKSENEKKYQLDNKNVSIFSYTSEFNDFLKTQDKTKIDESAIKTGDMLNLDFKDGKFTDKDDKNFENLPLIGVINDLLTDEIVKSKIDKDGDKKISDKEIKTFLESIENLDGKKGNISFDDLIKGTEKLKKTENKSSKKQIKKLSNGLNCQLGSQGISGVGGIYGAPSLVSFERTSQPTVSNNLIEKTDGETLEELERQQIEKENDLSNAQKAYDYVFSGNNDKVNAAIKNLNSSKENYEKLVDAEKALSDEQKNKLKEADKKVTDTKTQVSNAEKSLQETKNAVSSQENVVSSSEANLSALKDSLSVLNGQQSDNPEKQAEINSKISDLNSQISDAESKLNEDKKKLEELKQKGIEAEKTLNEKKTELETAKEEKTKLEQEFIINNENISTELKNALITYQEAEKNVTDVQNSEAEIAKSAIDKAQSELTEINNKINEKKAEETKNENKVSVSDLNVPELFGDNNQYDDLIEKYSNQYGIDPLLVKCVIKQESGFNTGDLSGAGATGLMQLMPETAVALGVDPYSIEGNLEGGIKYLKQQLDTFNGDVSLALAAYNAGPGAVQKYGGIPPYGETQHYVRIITDNYNSIK